MTADLVPGTLARACAEVRAAGPDDAVAGVGARFVACPGDVAEAAAVLRAAADEGLTAVPRGAGTRLAWGCPPDRCDLVIDTRGLNQVLEHAAGDLVVRVQAGVGLSQLAGVLAAAGQRLALDPPAPASGNGQRDGTVGGVLACGVAGPLRLRYGTPRDLAIGITVVRADGTVSRSGGKVVKNVAGYDLGKLFAGSYGTLGLIVEAAFRLHPLPGAISFVTLDAADAAAAAPRPHQEGGSGDTEAPDGTVIRIGFWAEALAGVLEAVDAAASDAGLDPVVGGSAAAGVIHVAVGEDAPADAVARLVGGLRAALGGPSAAPAAAAELAEFAGTGGPAPAASPSWASAVVLHAPAEVRAAVDLWGPVPALGLMRAVKDQFDPGHRMAPGRFAGGI